MNEPSDELRLLIARERDTDLPADAVVDEGWARLDAAVRGGLVPDPGLDAAIDPLAPATKVATATSTKLGVVVAAVVAGGVATWVATRDAVAPAEPERLAASSSRSIDPPKDPRTVDDPSEIETFAEPQAVSSTIEGSDESPEDTVTAVPPPRPRGAVRDEARDPADSLAAELALIEDARRALAEGRPERALELARRHARRHAAGALAEERHAVEALALCELGRPRGRGVADRFLREYPRSTHIDRVRVACIDADTPTRDEGGHP